MLEWGVKLFEILYLSIYLSFFLSLSLVLSALETCVVVLKSTNKDTALTLIYWGYF